MFTNKTEPQEPHKHYSTTVTTAIRQNDATKTGCSNEEGQLLQQRNNHRNKTDTKAHQYQYDGHHHQHHHICTQLEAKELKTSFTYTPAENGDSSVSTQSDVLIIVIITRRANRNGNDTCRLYLVRHDMRLLAHGQRLPHRLMGQFVFRFGGAQSHT